MGLTEPYDDVLSEKWKIGITTTTATEGLHCKLGTEGPQYTLTAY